MYSAPFAITDFIWLFDEFAKAIRAFAEISPRNSYRGPWRLIYYEAYLEQADALGRERYLKSGAGRRFLRSQLKHYIRKHPSKEAA
jgi:predicted GIY-YIG superfamily endonuclease